MDLQPLQIDRSKDGGSVRRPRRGWLGPLLVLLLLGGAGYVFRRPLLEQLDRWRLPSVRVLQVAVTSPLAAGAVQGTAANGYVVPRVRAALSADTPGRIVEMNVTEGSLVKKGEVVARLYSDEYRALFERAEADLGMAQAALASRRASRAVSASQLARAEADVRVSAAELEDARAALKLAGLQRERWQRLAAEKIATAERADTTQAEEEGAGARVQRAEAALTSAQEGVRSAQLSLALTETQLAEAAALITLKQAEVAQARATLDKTEVRAPFDGVVALKDAEVGEVVSPNAVGAQSRGSVVTMVDPATYEVQVELPETSLSAVVLGAPATIFIDAYPERSWPGRVLRIWPTANRSKATVELRVGFDDLASGVVDPGLRAEMGARVVFTPQGAAPADENAPPAEPVILIPRSALVTIAGQSCVFVLERDVARVRALELGDERSGRVVVRTGLVSGERIVDAPPVSLQDGDRVREEG